MEERAGARRIDHLGIAVRDLAAARTTFAALLGAKPLGEETVESEKVRVAFFRTGESAFELLEPTSPDSPVAKFLDKRGEGIHHVCLAVDDIDHEVARLRAQGFQFAGDAPRPGAGGARVAFVHPKSAGGILVELSQKPPGAHRH
jgi:methylmalonyl-CoA/ethylmalonyl-CoA epimerase